MLLVVRRGNELVRQSPPNTTAVNGEEPFFGQHPSTVCSVIFELTLGRGGIVHVRQAAAAY